MSKQLKAAAFIAFISVCAAGEASAAAQRTFVSPSGNDLNPCSLASPCRTFSAALAQTIAGGELVVLDSAAYGAVTISQSVSIVASPGVYAGISVVTPGTDAIAVNGAGVDVSLRGLAIVGLGGANGINVVSANSVRVERCTITGFTTTGIRVVAPGAKVSIATTELRGNSTGIDINAVATVEITDSRIAQSANNGVRADNGATLRIADTEVAENAGNGILLNASTGATVTRASVVRARITDNANRGLRAAPTAGTVDASASDTLIQGNASTGLSLNAVGATAVVRFAGNRMTVSSNGNGIAATANNGVTEVSLVDSTSSSNGQGGIGSQADGTGRSVVTAAGMQLHANGGGGASASAANTSTAKLSISRSVISRNGIVGTPNADGVAADADAGAVAIASVAESLVTSNLGDGFRTYTATSTILVSASTITENGGIGINATTGTVISAGNNITRNNVAGDVSGTLTPATTH